VSRPVDARLLRLAPALRRHLALSTAVAIATAGALLLQAEVLANGLERLVDGETSVVGSMVVGLGLVAVLRWAGAWCIEWSSASTLIETRRSIRHAVLERVERRADDATAEPAAVAALITTGADAMDAWIRMYLPALVAAAVVPLAVGIRILTADLVSALILALTIPLIPVFMVLIGSMTQDRTRRQWYVLARLAHHFHDVLVGMATLRMFGRAERQVVRVRAVSEQYRRSTMATLRIAFLSALVLELLATLSVAIVAVALGARLAAGGVGLTAALVVLLLAPECALPLRRVGSAYHAAMTGLDASNDVFRLLEQPVVSSGRINDVPEDITVRVQDLAVSSERGIRLASLTFTANPGEVTALVGPSGAGKSTAIDAIRAAVAPSEGSVTLGGLDVHALSIDARVRACAWVPAHPGPLGTTVWESAQIGSEPSAATDAVTREVLHALELDTMCTRAPARLSGGERQRLAVARAVIRVRTGAARVMLADEPTAHLDQARATQVWTCLQSTARAGATVIVATHDALIRDGADAVVTLTSAVSPSAGVADVPPTPSTPPTSIASLLPDVNVVVTNTPVGHGGGLRWAWTRMREWRARLLLGFALGALADLCAVGLIGIASWLIVRAAQQPSFEALALAAVGVRACGIGKGVFRYAERLVSHEATLRVLAETRAVVISAMARIAPAGLRRSRGDAMAGVVDDVDRMQDLGLRIVGPAVSVALSTGVAIVVTSYLNLRAGAVLAMVAVLVGLGLPAVLALRLRRDAAAVLVARASLAGAVLEFAEHATELAAHRGASATREAIERSARGVDLLDARRARYVGMGAAIVNAAPVITVAATLWVIGSAFASIAGPTAGVLVLWPLAVVDLVGSLYALGATVPAVSAASERVHQLIETPDPVPDPEQVVPLAHASELVVEDLSATWPGETHPSVGAVSFRASVGQPVELRGPSGSGKSSLAVALVRFIEITGGDARLDTTSIGAARGNDVRAHVMWAMQEPWIANTSIRENLRLGREDADEYACFDALRVVDLDRLVAGLPDGLDTMVGRDGMGLSSGQRHRLALARVMLSAHEVVILDEPTAHVDAPTARRMMDEIGARCSERVVVVLAHPAGDEYDADLGLVADTVSR